MKYFYAALVLSLTFSSCSSDGGGPCDPYRDALHGEFRQVQDPDSYISFSNRGTELRTAITHTSTTLNCTLTLTDDDCTIGIITLECDDFLIIGAFTETLTITSNDVIVYDDEEYRRIN